MMPSFGLIVLDANQEQSYYRDIGNHAASFGLTVHRFIPNAIDPYTEKITGETFDSGVWKPETFTIPDVLYDRCFYRTRQAFKTNAPIVEWLKNRAPFLGFGLPNKWKVYETLKNDPYLGHYTIETMKIDRVDTVLKELEKRKNVLLKPETGSQGKGIFIIKKHAGQFTVQTDRQGKTVTKTFLQKAHLKKWLNTQSARTTFLLQPFLALQNEHHQPFDIRIVVQKNSDGTWRERGRGIRVGKKDGLVSNLHNQGQLMNFTEWAKTLPYAKRTHLKNELVSIVERVPPLLEAAFGPLFELGLDIGVDRDGAIWILEANSKPGYRTLIESGGISQEQIAEAPLHYARHLLKEKELTNHAPSSETSKD
ncbi:MAG TPA: YheC/YheD family protein [Bacillales bacterium]|nr:YheC/YheD family protein [Bacillales bacterium]